MYSFIVPAFNEEATILNALARLREYGARLGDFEIVVVDDGSRDRTAAVVEEAARGDARLRLVRLSENQGKGAAVRAGMLAAKGEWRTFLDADLSTEPSEFERFRSHLESADIVVGSRGLPESTILLHQPFLRELSGKFFNLLVRTIVGLPIRDTQCGFKTFHARTAALFSEQTISGWAFDVEILARARRRGFKISEVPITWRNDPTTTVKMSAGFKAIADLFRIRCHSRGGGNQRSSIGAVDPRVSARGGSALGGKPEDDNDVT